MTKSTCLRLGLGAAILVAGGPLVAKDRQAPPAIVKTLLDCRAISEAAARLACFDAQVAEIGKAMDADDLVIADRSQVEKAKRSLFGLNLQDFNLFGGNDDSKGVVASIESTITETRQGPDRNWRFTLADGSRWVQTDVKSFARYPRPGMPIAIRRAAMGSYLANVDKQIAVRVQRVN